MPKVYYENTKKMMNIKEIYKLIKKSGKANIVGSVLVYIHHEDYEESLPDKKVFVRDRDPKKYYTIISGIYCGNVFCAHKIYLSNLCIYTV